jgi:hypothetical protein
MQARAQSRSMLALDGTASARQTLMDDTRTEHDIWMAKIMAAVRSVRLANQLTPEQLRSFRGPSQDTDRGTRGPPVA